MNEKRPETFADCTGYDTEPKTLVEIKLEPLMFGGGVLGAIDRLIADMRTLYGDQLAVTADANRVEARRPLSDDEQAEVLDRHQRQWDQASGNRALAEQLKELKVGDPIDVVVHGASCRSIRNWDCDLPYDHAGDHIRIEDGRVASRTAVRS